MRRRWVRIAAYSTAVLAALTLIALLALLLILPSQWFREKVRDRIIAEVEQSTGGRVEIGVFEFDWHRLTAHIAPFTLHGSEPAGEAPLLHADRVEVGLKILSALRRDVDIASLRIDKPEMNLFIDEQGRSNIPNPKVDLQSTDPMQTILDLAVKQFSVNSGTVHIGDRRLPLDLAGQDLEIHLTYGRIGPKYAGQVSMQKLTVEAGPVKPVTVGLDSRIQLERNTLIVESARITTPRSNAAVSGRLSDFRDPKVQFNLEAKGDLAELGGPLGLPPPHTGTVTFTGSGTYSQAESFRLAGRAGARGLALDQEGIRIRNVAVDSDLRLSPGELRLSNLRVGALGGQFSGSASLEGNFKKLQMKGQISRFTLRTLAEAEGIRNPAWDGAVSGPIELTTSLQKGTRDLSVSGKMQIAPIAGAPPFEGKVDFAFDQRSGHVRLGPSFVTTPASHANFSGTLGESLQVHLETHDLEDLLPAVAMVSPERAPAQLPLRITKGGTILFEGVAKGPSDQMEVSGVLRAQKLMVEDRPINSFRATVDVSPSGIRLHNADVTAAEAEVSGTLEVGLSDWKLVDSSPLNGRLRLQAASISALLRANHISEPPVEGPLQADFELKGTAADPAATGKIMVVAPTILGEKFDRLQADIRHTGAGVEHAEGQLDAGAGRIEWNGTYTHPPKEFQEGQISFQVVTRNLALGQFKTVNDLRPGVSGRFEVNAKGVAGVRNAQVALHELTGQVVVRDLMADGRALGDVSVDVSGRQDVLDFTAKGALRGSEIQGKGSFSLTGDYLGQGEFSFTPMAVSVLQDIAFPEKAGSAPPPVDGVVSGRLTFSGPARFPDKMTGRLELPILELVPARQIRDRDKQRDLALRNQGPVIIERDAKGFQVRSAKFVGTDTNLDLSGTLNLAAKNPWDLKVNGSLNLGVLEEFSPDTVTTGVATVNATIRGTLDNPQVLGRLELKDASLYLADLPNGLDQASGVVVFDPNRATIEKLTATTGGGRITLSGYIVYGSGEPAFRLQVRADGVRIRYPEGVSTSSNAALNISGSKSQSLLSGTITVLRASFNPQTDVGSLIAGAGKPIETPTAPNQYLRDMHLDVRVETVPNLSLQTTLSRNLQAQADLRVRGTAAKPSVLGHITVTQGEIEFFGNKYQINRGEVSFYNLVRIEPVIAMDLETKVRGVDVNISLSGTWPNKLNFSYRSDPPLQSNEIIALLAMGRDPTSYGGLGSAQMQSSTSSATGALTPTGSMIGSALAAPVSNRLQRFFGVSRLKIDPSLTTMTGSSSTQSRLGLTIEQQVSRDITVTYVANLTDANQQIVRVQWDLNRKWSIVALREENGLFGVDIQYRKRFK